MTTYNMNEIKRIVGKYVYEIKAIDTHVYYGILSDSVIHSNKHNKLILFNHDSIVILENNFDNSNKHFASMKMRYLLPRRRIHIDQIRYTRNN